MYMLIGRLTDAPFVKIYYTKYELEAWLAEFGRGLHFLDNSFTSEHVQLIESIDLMLIPENSIYVIKGQFVVPRPVVEITKYEVA